MSLSQEMYTRIYRLFKRNVNAQNIASTLKIPFKTVQSVINRFETITKSDTPSDEFVPPESLTNSSDSDNLNDANEGFLDIYFYQKTRYTILQFVGSLTSHFSVNINNELEKALKSNWKAVALRMKDVYIIDKTISDLILTYNAKFTALMKFFAILDPATEIEPLLKKYDIEDKIPVFGTERAFEENAFSKKNLNFTKRI